MLYGNIYKRCFEHGDFEKFSNDFEIFVLNQETMNRYEKTKLLWELFIKIT